MTREREEKTPQVLVPEGEAGAEDESQTAAPSVLKQEETLHALEAAAAQIVPPEDAAGPGDPLLRRARPAAEPASEKRDTKEVHQLLLNAVNQNANRNNRRLRAQLTGRVQLNLRGSAECYLLAWRSEALRVEERRDAEAECTIELGSADLFDIARGELNPQIAMLSDKIRVSGESRMAIYFFNLFGTA